MFLHTHLFGVPGTANHQAIPGFDARKTWRHDWSEQKHLAIAGLTNFCWSGNSLSNIG